MNDTAAKLFVSDTRIRQLVQDGKLTPAKKNGRHLLFDPREVEAYRSARDAPPATAASPVKSFEIRSRESRLDEEKWVRQFEKERAAKRAICDREHERRMKEAKGD